MKILLVLAVFFVINIKANASDFNSFFETIANRHAVLKEFNRLKTKHIIYKTSSIEDRIVLGNIQLSLEEAIVECLKNKECTSASIAIQTPLPATPLRADEANIIEVSGLDNKEVNDILLARKNALIELSKSDVRIILSYKKDGNKAINYDKYHELTSNSEAFIDCKGCYNFFDDMRETGSWYRITMNDDKKVIFTIHNTQLLEKNSKQEIKVIYKY